MRDKYKRDINYMRISITDRCNLRCTYCMPPEGIESIPMEEILSFEEILQVVRAAVELGITRFRITGGEPLVRRGVENLVGMIKSVEGVEQVNITTNGVLLKEKLPDLIAKGLDGVNISLDTTDSGTFEKLTRRDCYDQVTEAIDAAVESGIKVKLNAVLWDKSSYKDMIELAREKDLCLRFIELMPIGDGAKMQGASNEEVFTYLKEKYPDMTKDDRQHGNGPAVYYKIPGFKGSIGFISPIHGVFCSSCNRIRLSATGQLKPCLCYGDTLDVKSVIRQGKHIKKEAASRNKALQEEIKGVLQQAILQKPQAHCFDNRSKVTENHKMVSIGG